MSRHLAILPFTILANHSETNCSMKCEVYVCFLSVYEFNSFALRFSWYKVHIRQILHFCCFAGCLIEEALEAASLHPASTINISDHKGRLNFGYDADLVVLDNDLHVVSTFLAGKKVWSRDGLKPN